MHTYDPSLYTHSKTALLKVIEYSLNGLLSTALMMFLDWICWQNGIVPIPRSPVWVLGTLVCKPRWQSLEILETISVFYHKLNKFHTKIKRWTSVLSSMLYCIICLNSMINHGIRKTILRHLSGDVV